LGPDGWEKEKKAWGKQTHKDTLTHIGRGSERLRGRNGERQREREIQNEKEIES